MLNGWTKKKTGKEYNFSEAKEEWRELCEKESSMWIYQKAWYWDAVCENSDDWQVILIKENEQIEAAFPFIYQKRKGLWIIETPWQVAASGIWMRTRQFKNVEANLNYMTKMINGIVDRLPYYDRFQVIFNKQLWSWQPFYWRGFEARPYYTMVIGNMPVEDVKSHLSKSRKVRINKAERLYRIETDKIAIDEYWDFFERSYKNRGKVIEFGKEKFVKLISALKDHGAVQIRAVYREAELVAENIIFMDDDRFYHHFVTQMKDSDKDASSYAVYDAICEAMKQGKEFDFEGSMIPGVCEFNSSFHPEWEVQYCIMDYSKKYLFLNGVRKGILMMKDSVKQRFGN